MSFNFVATKAAAIQNISSLDEDTAYQVSDRVCAVSQYFDLPVSTNLSRPIQNSKMLTFTDTPFSWPSSSSQIYYAAFAVFIPPAFALFLLVSPPTLRIDTQL